MPQAALRCPSNRLKQGAHVHGMGSPYVPHWMNMGASFVTLQQAHLGMNMGSATRKGVWVNQRFLKPPFAASNAGSLDSIAGAEFVDCFG